MRPQSGPIHCECGCTSRPAPQSIWRRFCTYVQGMGSLSQAIPLPEPFISMNKRNHYTRYRQIWLPIQETKKKSLTLHQV